MTKLDWQRDRTRQQMMTAAANRLPGIVRASFDSTCPECQRPYKRGDRIIRLTTGWGHPSCKK